jgi:tetratricopeptide (TPR) repeat protein
MAYTDVQGLAVSTTSADALAAYEQGIDFFLRWRGGAPEALNAALTYDPHFVLAHCTQAYVAWRMGKADVALEAHKRVMAVADSVRHEREHLHVRTVDAMQQCDAVTAQTLLEQLAAQYPTDRVAVRLLGFHYIAQGNYRGGLEIARRSLEACPDDTQF